MQAVDLSRLSLDKFAAISGKPLVRETLRKARTDITDALRTVYWFRGIERRTAIKTSTGLEKRFEPELSIKPKLSDESRKNKWGKYRYGRHVPSPELMKVVESALPGLSWQLNHPLWELLASETVDIDSMLRKLDTPLRDRLLRTKAKLDAKSVRTKPIDKTLAKALLRHAGLDSLAAVILLFKRAIQEQNDNAALAWSREIYRQLMVLGYHLSCQAVALPLFELIEKRVISPHSINGQRYFFPADFYMPAIGMLLDTMYHLKDHQYESMSARDKNVQMTRILGGDYGWDCKFAFNPFKTDCKDPIDSQNQAVWLFIWAWNMLDSGGHREFPPEPVFDGTDLHARYS